MKKLNITKEAFNKSNYFQTKYGKLEYVSESGKVYKTDKGNVIKFVSEARKYNESSDVKFVILKTSHSFTGCVKLVFDSLE